VLFFRAPGNSTLDEGERPFRKSCKKGEFPEFKKIPKNQLKPENYSFKPSEITKLFFNLMQEAKL
jgi:hypothetical protein